MKATVIYLSRRATSGHDNVCANQITFIVPERNGVSNSTSLQILREDIIRNGFSHAYIDRWIMPGAVLSVKEEPDNAVTGLYGEGL